MLGSCDSKLDNWSGNSMDNFESEYGGWLSYLKNFNRTTPIHDGKLSTLPNTPVEVFAVVPPPILPCQA